MSARPGAVDPGDARRVARRILSGRQFRAAPTPRPFRGVLRWIGDRLHPIVSWVGHVVADVAGTWLVVPAGLVVAAALVYVAVRVRGRRRRPDARRDAYDMVDDHVEDPNELERAAERAERDGQLDHALRLRFRAGLLRLGDRGAIRYRPSLTTGEVRRALGSETFDELARTFETVAYGGRDAVGDDVATARREWPRVVAGATGREGR
jgi:hypothetical protein